MTKEEAINIINCYDIGFYDLSGEKIPADKLAEAFNMATEALKERPKGEWIDMNGATVFPFWQRYKCSVCGERADMSNYCPRCGSRMKGADND